MTQSPSIGALAAALAKAQGALRPAAKDSANPFFKSSYADLTSVWEACRAALSANALAVVQTTESIGEATLMHTTLIHSSGEWISGSYPIRPIKNDPQGIGSAITYARRYSLAAMVGVVADDDDGEAAQGRARQQPKVNTAGEVVKKKPAWSDAQKIAAGELKAKLMAFGDGGAEAFDTLWREHQYDEPDSVIALLTTEMNAWKG